MMWHKRGIKINYARFDKGVRKLRPWYRNSLSGHKWADWVRSLIARYRRLGSRQGVLDFVLFHRVPLLQRLNAQWLVSTCSLYPQVRLAIQPIQLQTVWRHQHLPGRQPCIQLLKGKDNWRQFAKLPVENWHLESRHLLKGRSSGQSRAKKDSVIEKRLSSTRDFPFANFKLPSSLQLVFQRTFQVNEFIQCHQRRNITQESFQALAREVVHRTQRIEQRPVETVSLATRKNLLIGNQKAVVAESPMHAGINTPNLSSVPTHSWTGNTPLAQSINIEQLTDQVVKKIDRRIIAARERMGRI
ncbi:hypothetical protein [Nitrosococcus oceani]|nr:hypothetical protein [Nitrosococcus oceani]